MTRKPFFKDNEEPGQKPLARLFAQGSQICWRLLSLPARDIFLKKQLPRPGGQRQLRILDFTAVLK